MGDASSAVVGWFLGLITAGLGAWFGDFFQTKRRNDALRRALISELLENRIALLRRKRTRVHRSAWDAARAIQLPDDAFSAIAAAYVALDRVAVVMDLSLTRSASQAASSLEEIFRSGGPINYNETLRKVDVALRALGVQDTGGLVPEQF